MMNAAQSIANIWCSMMSRSTQFPVFVRMISLSSIRQKVQPPKDKVIKIEEKERFPVETDTEKLAKYVCGTNLFTEGEDVKLKEDSEYPDWLWKIRSPPPLEELDQNTKTYWNRIRRMRSEESKHLLTLQKHKTVHK